MRLGFRRILLVVRLLIDLGRFDKEIEFVRIYKFLACRGGVDENISRLPRPPHGIKTAPSPTTYL
jgi:hypothetical protein